MINESDCSRDFSKEMTKKYRDTHKKIRNCNEFDNSLNFAKISIRLLVFSDVINRTILWLAIISLR
jgi:hypothetical protein